MTTPSLTLPRAVFLEIGVDGAWQRVTTAPEFSDVLQTEPLEIERGRADEQTAMPPCALGVSVLNDNGKYTPSNPNSPLYGDLNLNTPVRQGFLVDSDDFNRVVPGGWGFTSQNYPWFVLWSGVGTGYVDGTRAVHSVGSTGSYVRSRAGEPMAGGYVKIDYTPAFTDITGGSIEPANVIMRWLDENNYYMVRLEASVSEVYTLRIIRRCNAVETFIDYGTYTIPGITHTIGQTISVAAILEGRTIRAKAWLASNPEPYAWQVTGDDDDMDDSNVLLGMGMWGVRSGVSVANTNALPVLFNYDNVDVRAIRLSGELTGNKPSWNVDHTNKTAQLTVRGLLRRLKQGDAPVRSPMRRAYDGLVGYFGTAQLPPVAYWPCEDGPRSDSISSGLTNGVVMLYNGPIPDFASFTGFVCSAPLLQFNQADLTGELPLHTGTGKYMLRFLLGVPSGGTVDLDVIGRIFFHTGSIWFVDIMYHSNGNVSLQAYDFGNALLHNTGQVGVGNLNGRLVRMQLDLYQDGADVKAGIWALEVGGGVGYGFLANWAGRTLGTASRVVFNPYRNIDGVGIGHIAVHTEISTIFDYEKELKGFTGETTGIRFLRLCAENGIDGAVWGHPYGTAMGPQRVANIVELLQECADTEQGIMFEAMTFSGLFLRMRDTIYAQDPVLVLDYSAGEVAPPLSPANDDAGLINDVSAERFLGSTFRTFKEQGTGPKNAGRPWEDPEAVGPYTGRVPVNPMLDIALRDIADQALRIGTSPDTRYPQITVDLAATEIDLPTLMQVLAVNIGDRVQVISLGAADIYTTVDQVVQGYNEVYPNQYLHRITFNATQFSPYNIIILDETLLDGDVFAAEPIDTTETLIDYTCSPPLETDPSVFPYNVLVGGEEWTVTSATSTTMTVVRSVNGIVKSHASGVRIELTDQSSYLGR